MHTIAVSLVYAESQQQWLYETSVPRGTDARDLILQSGFLTEIESLNSKSCEELELANYARPIKLDYMLQANDRVEIIRPLLADPKEVRRQLAALGKTMSSRKKSSSK